MRRLFAVVSMGLLVAGAAVGGPTDDFAGHTTRLGAEETEAQSSWVAPGVLEHLFSNGAVIYEGRGTEGFEWLQASLQGVVTGLKHQLAAAPAKTRRALSSQLEMFEVRLLSVESALEELYQRQANGRYAADADWFGCIGTVAQVQTQTGRVDGHAWGIDCGAAVDMVGQVCVAKTGVSTCALFRDRTTSMHLTYGQNCSPSASVLVQAYAQTPYTWSMAYLNGCY